MSSAPVTNQPILGYSAQHIADYWWITYSEESQSSMDRDLSSLDDKQLQKPGEIMLGRFSKYQHCQCYRIQN